MMDKIHELISRGLSSTTTLIEPLGSSQGPIFKITDGTKRWIAKCLKGPNALHRLSSEKKGLDLINSHCKGLCPTSLPIIQDGAYVMLIMDHINDSSVASDGVLIADVLCQLHRVTDETFGLTYDNYIGELPQYNTPYSDWPTFWYERRMIPLIEHATRFDLLDFHSLPSRSQFIRSLTEQQEFPFSPCLVHGDLWQGNMLFEAPNGTPRLIDPAIYFGDPMVDIAMMELFGGFPASCFSEYFERRPNSNKNCIPIYKLYYLLVHLCMFGSSYLRDCKQILSFIKRF